MERADLIASLPRLKQDLREAERRVVEAQVEVDALRGIIAGIERLASTGQQLRIGVAVETSEAMPIAPVVNGPDNVPTTAVEAAPKGRAAIHAIMGDGRPWTLQALIGEMRRRGWVSSTAKRPDSAIRETIRRLHEKDELEKVGPTTYRLVRPTGLAPTVGEGANGNGRSGDEDTQ